MSRLLSRTVLLSVLLLVGTTQSSAADAAGPLSPEETVRRMQLPPGFKATVFAAEPDVVQPIAMTFDDRGRLWVVECLSYPEWITPDGYLIENRKKVRPPDPRRAAGRDRITIFEDTDGDGRHDKRTVFYKRGRNFTGIACGFGGVFVTAVPYLLFIPDKNRDDRPDGEPQILLDGWDIMARHNVVNGLTWGPDGWLYGCNGILSNSEVRVVADNANRQRQRPEKNQKRKAESGKPPLGKRSSTANHQPSTKMNCGVWRYHPTRKIFEVVAHGTTNPWGLDFNEEGEAFITNCVIKHVFHVIPGAHYERMYGQDITPHVYGLMKSCADHIHWGGGKWTSSRGGKGIHDKPGGGHAHAGCMIYLGDNWPKEYRGNLFTCNIHGHRVNRDIIRRHRSGYVVSHGPDFLKVPDPWFRGLELKYGPDGGVYLIDWCDDGECHDRDGIHRENGRIYKITYGEVKPWHGDLATWSDARLRQLSRHKNRWFVRRARRILQERHPAKPVLFPVPEDPRGEETRLIQTLRRILESRTIHDEKSFGPLLHVAQTTKSPRLRLAFASALQRLTLKDRWEMAEALVQHAEDADDPNIPLMIWYGIEPAVSADPQRAVQLLKKTKIPLIRQYIARRLAELAE